MRSTRGAGLLEGVLARLRGRIGKRLLSAAPSSNLIADLGCGVQPLFLMQTDFRVKIGIDKEVVMLTEEWGNGDRPLLLIQDLEHHPSLPLRDDTFDAVTMLASLEHFTIEAAGLLIGEIHRVLKPGGIFVATTPAPWGHKLLDCLSKVDLVSAEEINDHKTCFSKQSLAQILRQGGFGPERIRVGYFECSLNMWVCAAK